MRCPTAIETFLAAAFVAALAFLVAPDLFRAREAYAVELAARAASACDVELASMASAGPAPDPSAGGSRPPAPTLAEIDGSLAARGAPALVWPREADLSTVDFSSTGGVSVLLRLRGGERRVTARDLDVDHAN